MYYYFSSGYPAAIKFNGIYYGLITDTIKPLKIEDGTFPLVEVCPVGNSNGNLTFILNDEFLRSPTEYVVVTDLKGGYLIKFLPQHKDGAFKIICQQKFSDAVCTLFNENGIKLSIETHDDFYAENLNLKTTTAKIERFSLGQSNFVAIFLEDISLLSVYCISNKIAPVFCRMVNSFDLSNGFTTTECLKDMAKHQVVSVWEENGGRLKEKSRLVSRAEKFDKDKLPLPLLPYAFIEEFLVGGEFLDYLSNEMKEKATHLKGFFGDFIGVMPPPEFIPQEQVGLIYRKKENAYQVEYYDFEFVDRKISNIKQVE